ncbi:tetraacyldisaccharide 4'-kinase, partial [bacterium]|nr:tetraacyldisaccharide 4'-kinase [bacterium]
MSGYSYLTCSLAIMYQAGVAVHRNLYKLNMLQKMRLSVPVIGVGNLSFGGSGKTLVVQAIAERLVAEGLKVGIVCRSYGAAAGPHILNGGGQGCPVPGAPDSGNPRTGFPSI